ncbi:hypothetical protein ACFFL1_09255 [Samsonia erythrinae]|nr:hypothetical protein [Samsonia erythrinae]
MGTLKETLIFAQGDNTHLHRYEIYKSQHNAGYFAVIYTQKTFFSGDEAIMAWTISEPYHGLTSRYIPNARIECENHWREAYRAMLV